MLKFKQQETTNEKYGGFISKMVIALGGNALGKNPEEQLSLLEGVAK